MGLLGELVAQPSLTGAKQSAQALMRRGFQSNGMRVHGFAIDEAELRNHPGYLPSIIPRGQQGSP